MDATRVQLALELLRGTTAMRGVLDRDEHIYLPSQATTLPTLDLAPDFFEARPRGSPHC